MPYKPFTSMPADNTNVSNQRLPIEEQINYAHNRPSQEDIRRMRLQEDIARNTQPVIQMPGTAINKQDAQRFAIAKTLKQQAAQEKQDRENEKLFNSAMSLVPGYLIEEGVNAATKELSNGKYNSWGDMLNKVAYIDPTIGELANPGYYSGLIAKGVGNGAKFLSTLPRATYNPSKLGYWGDNYLSRWYGTNGRRFGYPGVKPHTPELIRRIHDDPTINTDGTIQIQNPNSALLNTTTHSTFTPHQKYKYRSISDADAWIINGDAVPKENFLSIEPSDTCFIDKGSFDPKDLTLITGSKDKALKYKNAGVNVIFDKKLSSYKVPKNFSKLSLKDLVSQVRPDAHEYRRRLENIISNRGKSKIYDYKLFENETGLPSYVYSESEYPALLYPYYDAANGRMIPSERMMDTYFDGVNFDPSSPVESLMSEFLSSKPHPNISEYDKWIKMKDKKMQDKFYNDKVNGKIFIKKRGGLISKRNI